MVLSHGNTNAQSLSYAQTLDVISSAALDLQRWQGGCLKEQLGDGCNRHPCKRASTPGFAREKA